MGVNTWRLYSIQFSNGSRCSRKLLPKQAAGGLFAARFTGDDVRYIRRKGEMSPPFPDLELEEGDPIDCSTFPKIFPPDEQLPKASLNQFE